MPRTLAGLVGFLVASVFATGLGLFIIMRVPPLRDWIMGVR